VQTEDSTKWPVNSGSRDAKNIYEELKINKK